MNFKKQYISPLFTILAMILLLISRSIGEQPMDWLGYLAIVVIIASIFGLIGMAKKS